MSGIPQGMTKISGSFKIGEHQTALSSSYRSDFSVNADSWIDANHSLPEGNIDNVTDGTTSKNDCLRITCTLTGGTPRCQRNQTLTVGKRYRVKYEYYIPNSMAISSLKLYSGALTTLLFTSSVKGSWAQENQEITITTAPSNQWIQLNITAAATNDYAYIKNFSIEEIPPLPTFTNGTKYLECVTAGVIAIPSKQAYGTWEFDWYKGADANTLVLGISQKAGSNVYSFFFSNTERFVFSKYYGGSYTEPVYTAASYLTINTWYRVRIIRTLAGVFTFLIKGGALTPTAGYDGWTLISVSGGLGTNPYTDTSIASIDSIYFDLDAGDRIANVNVYDGIKV